MSISQKDQLDQQIGQHLKTGWTVGAAFNGKHPSSRIYEMTEFDTPQIVAVNEAVQGGQAFSDETSSRFGNGVLQSICVGRINAKRSGKELN